MKTQKIYMSPDYEELFWDEEDCGIGNSETLYINDDLEIILKIDGLTDWISKYVDEILIPCATGKISLDEFNKKYDWNSFHKEGIRLAYEVRKVLPDNIELFYKTPFEYQYYEIPHCFKIVKAKSINTLSFSVEDVCVTEGSHKDIQYKAFYYLIDGMKIEYDNYNPLDASEICETEDLLDSQSIEYEQEDFTAVLLNHCRCGLWECNAMVAQVVEEGNIFRWRIHRNCRDIIIQEFIFDKTEYKETIKMIINEAEKLIMESNINMEKGKLLWQR